MPADERPLGEILRTAREAAGWSLARVAQATGYSKPYLSKLETGGKKVKPWHIQAYDRAPEGEAVQRRVLLMSGVREVPRAVWAELELPTAPPRRLGADDVAGLAESADFLTGLGLRHGGRAAVAAVRGQLRYAASLLDLSMSDEARRSLLVTVARLADRTAWAMADIGQVKPAHKIYDFSLSVAPDKAQRWLTLVNIADLRLRQGDPQTALRLLDRDDPGVPVLRFLVNATRAHAHASLGEYTATLRHVDMADASHADVDLNDLPDALHPYVSGHRGHAHAEAGKALHALAGTGSKSARPLALERLHAAVRAFGSDRAHAVAGCRRRIESLIS
jgi:hypothetical protein